MFFGGSHGTEADRHVPVTTPRSAAVVFVPLVNFSVQQDDTRSLHRIQRMVCDVCPGCPYIINFFSNTVAAVVVCNAATCSPFFSEKAV